MKRPLKIGRTAFGGRPGGASGMGLTRSHKATKVRRD